MKIFDYNTFRGIPKKLYPVPLVNSGLWTGLDFGHNMDAVWTQFGLCHEVVWTQSGINLETTQTLSGCYLNLI